MGHFLFLKEQFWCLMPPGGVKAAGAGRGSCSCERHVARLLCKRQPGPVGFAVFVEPVHAGRKMHCRIDLRMNFLVAALLSLAGSAALADNLKPAHSTLRCGWFDNPTPANAWLVDREGEWTVGIQGGHQAEGEWPTFAPRQWVKTNGGHGHGCACLTVVADPETHEILRIVSARAVPLSQCRRDRALKEPV